MTLYGWDASDFDWARGPMDLAAAKADGITWFTHKATESTNVRHLHLGDALNRGRAAGFEFLGAYHVVRTSPSAQAQVDYFLAYLDQAVPWWRSFPGFLLQVDLELWPYDQVSAATGAAFALALQAAQPKRVLTYASRGMYGNSLTGLDTPLWNANYPNGDPIAHYRQAYPGDNGAGWLPYSGRSPVMWQYGSRLTIGSQPGCDANAFRGSLDDLWRLIMSSEEFDVDVLRAENPQQGEIDAWRLDALAVGLDTVRGGPTNGEPMQIVRDVHAIMAQLGRIEAALVGGGPGGPSLDQIRTVVDEELDEQSRAGADND